MFFAYLFVRFLLLTLYGASNKASMSKSSAMFLLCFEIVFFSGGLIYLFVVAFVVVVVVDKIACWFYRCKFTVHCYANACCCETQSVRLFLSPYSFTLAYPHCRLSTRREKNLQMGRFTQRINMLLIKTCCLQIAQRFLFFCSFYQFASTSMCCN